MSRPQAAWVAGAPADPPLDHAREMLGRVARQACTAAGLDRACVFLRDQLSEVSMTVAAVHGLPSELVGRSFGILDGTAGRVLITGRPVLLHDGRALPRPLDQALGATRSVASVPMSWGGTVRAGLSAGSSDPRRGIGAPELEVLCRVSELGARAVEQAEARQELEVAVTASLAALARSADIRDGRLPDQSERVAELACAVGRDLGLAGAELAELEAAALLRDVGKIGLPDGILRNPGPLSARDWDAMRRHPELGGEMIFAVPGLEGAAAIVVHHHEHYDGRGYPDRLAGEDIPLRSRIVSVCDAYDAMTSDRPYRPALRPIKALRELERRAGTQFDPEAVAALRRVARVGRMHNLAR